MSAKIKLMGFCLTLLLFLTGCDSLLESEYISVTDYVDDNQSDTGDAITITDYSGLKRRIEALVESRGDELTLQLIGYEGDVSDDIGRACTEVKINTAYGAYAIDYMSNDKQWIVSYYEVTIQVTYKKTAAEMDAILELSSLYSAREEVQKAAAEMSDTLVFRLASATLDESAIIEYVQEAYYPTYGSSVEIDRSGILRMPEISVNIYPDSGQDRIFEVTLDFGVERDEIEEMRQALGQALADIDERVTAKQTIQAVTELCREISGLCEYDPESQQRAQELGEDSGLGSTAYGALVEGYADCEGLAMAFAQACRLREIECYVVRGQQGVRDHVWNIVGIDGQYYHVDVSQYALGITSPVLKGDADMQANYLWNQGVYPECPATYYGTVAASAED